MCYNIGKGQNKTLPSTWLKKESAIFWAFEGCFYDLVKLMGKYDDTAWCILAFDRGFGTS